jgi:Transcriptional regulators
MPTIYDIARICGLSPATVSKALSGAPDVSAATRSKVRLIAGKIDYIPDGRARGLSQNRTWTISILCQDESGMGLTHYLFAEIIESFKGVVERHGYDIIFISNKVGDRSLSYYEHCRYRKVDGVFVINTNHDSKEAQELMSSDLPKIALDYSNGFIGGVMTDSGKSMALIYNHLYELGHRNIAYMHGDDKYITGLRIESLKKAIAAKGEAVRPGTFIKSKYYSIREGYNSMKELLGRSERPTAVIASDDYSAVGAINAIRDCGLSVPEDISIVGFDGIEITQLMSPRLTTIRQNTAGMGAKAAESLIQQILSVDPYIPINILLEPQLIVGNSTKHI